MRPIGADALHFNRIRIAHEDGTVGGYNAVVMSAEIKDAPTIDAVPVVRCKECKYRPIDTGGHNYGQDLLFPDDYKCPCRCDDQWYSWMPGDDWFCANGERSEFPDAESEIDKFWERSGTVNAKRSEDADD